MGEMAALPRGGVAGMVRFREEASPALGLERLPGSWGNGPGRGRAPWGPLALGRRAGHRARQEISGCRVTRAISSRTCLKPLFARVPPVETAEALTYPAAAGAG